MDSLLSVTSGLNRLNYQNYKMKRITKILGKLKDLKSRFDKGERKLKRVRSGIGCVVFDESGRVADVSKWK